MTGEKDMSSFLHPCQSISLKPTNKRFYQTWKIFQKFLTNNKAIFYYF